MTRPSEAATQRTTAAKSEEWLCGLGALLVTRALLDPGWTVLRELFESLDEREKEVVLHWVEIWKSDGSGAPE